jgi:hypothetical protein
LDVSTNASTGGAGITAFGASNTLTKFNGQGPPSGSAQVAFIQGEGTLSQAISGFSTDTSYIVTFNVAQRALSSPESLNILADGVSIGTYDPLPANPFAPGWTSVTTRFFSPSLDFHGTEFT